MRRLTFTQKVILFYLAIVLLFAGFLCWAAKPIAQPPQFQEGPTP